jgi:hypothetical protein
MGSCSNCVFAKCFCLDDLESHLQQPPDSAPFSFVVVQEARMNLLGVEPFQGVFGSKSTRKRPKLSFVDVDELAKRADDLQGAAKLSRGCPAL